MENNIRKFKVAIESNVIDNCNLNRVLDASQFERCPYLNADSEICVASISSISIDPSRKHGYCSTDNYENCALFLAKTLRNK